MNNGVAKYVIIKDSHGVETAYIFDGKHQHRWFAEKMGGMPVSAGFVMVRGHGVVCMGESMSLNIKARDIDAEIIRKLLSVLKK